MEYTFISFKSTKKTIYLGRVLGWLLLSVIETANFKDHPKREGKKIMYCTLLQSIVGNDESDVSIVHMCEVLGPHSPNPRSSLQIIIHSLFVALLMFYSEH